MIKKKIAFTITCLLSIINFASAREGMWLPNLIKALKQDDLKAMGLQLSVDEIFRADGKGLNNAIVQFGGGCTGEIISEKGLLLTNHHCGFSQIQSLSSIEHNYLENGYWAKSTKEEFPCPGLTVTFVREIKDVTSIVLKSKTRDLSNSLREKEIKTTCDSIEKSVSLNNGVTGFVRSFFNGTAYYLFITETFKDIRFVGAPPANVGNFGGETDNWMWPRHTADFSVFRIYADKNNGPAEYAADNVPYHSNRFLKINACGVKEGDFTMVYGFPGKTQEYLTSGALELLQQQTNPDRIALRDIRMKIWQDAMRENDTIRLQYSSKFRGLANAYKKWKGELNGLEKSNVVEKKRQEENKFYEWAKKNSPIDTGLIFAINQQVEKSKELSLFNDYYLEGFSGIEMIALAMKLKPLADLCNTSPKDEAKIKQTAERFNAELPSFYKNYRIEVDKKATAIILKSCHEKLPVSFQPDFLKAFANNPEEFTGQLFNESFLANEKSASELLGKIDSSKIIQIQNDPAWKIAAELIKLKNSIIDPTLNKINDSVATLQRQYMMAYQRWKSPLPCYPDANSTLRLSYGKVQGISPKDGISYQYYTTSNGILEKYQTGETDYKTDQQLIELLKQKDFGPYGEHQELHTAFLASNHTTGGNSGSPVLNSKGELIGINFDRIWEGVMSDLYYDVNYSRNVAVDIRYVLFIIDKLGQADWLLNEMDIKWKKTNHNKN